ncbi:MULTISPECIES: 2,3,4,5-tetrahydropyridine-2,6-dicarboxylate N-acetyltransferase [Carnobacterium]|uniref:2,3,4,5-tetrahydropyridine-2,6-dicarboxylate N-acetyltransferase n=1 Tax=Carnobacterium TaxID=2747 RepID=UPI00288C91FA|nr:MULTISPECIES: 2,3,4,5-tetrahydropyridine-2,6-dicarboxylate N-acetyltransferase [Carnobacterium]MDT1939334.1 2,3,4,5-tetrahydropyridine-2,6-dicarboxylate N-acetyltransferase [Carnobacterium divergens]MDT1941772.1 2,3,4,5-tetrahydropyridine-2,6-dicarboxylate N-acetyltransferase [Carnobacterium divergens]MDT1947570.1 2,3,4,5-tetrahydropyridine-2,6-dicarboxylate N-acetyltransferase [Carnobacterium divergens]MDT1950009.1 2,3,4,5-tetrahydropyridine-2,6-dicarboxylate N-acetyltransferase [Carnobacte
MDANEIIAFIANSEKKTPVKVYIKGSLKELTFPDTIQHFTNCKTGVLFGDWKDVEPFLKENQVLITDQVVENDRRNSAVPLVDMKGLNARIEPGAILRDQVEIGNQAVIMMGALINIGAVVGDNTMIDMGAVLGGRATVGKNCHIGAGTVLAGVVEPASAQPVVVEDDVLIGANAVVLEGIRVGKGAVVAAGAIVVNDVAPYTVVAGVPAKKIKDIDEKTKSKTSLIDELRKL